MTTLHTPNYGIAYIDTTTTLDQLAQASQDAATTIDAALGRGGIAPPDATTQAQLAARITALETAKRDLTLGDAYLPAQVTIAGPTGWTTLASVTATSDGSQVAVRGLAVVVNGFSGGDRTANFQLLCDSTTLVNFANFSVPLGVSSGPSPRIPRAASLAHTPAAGSHTWTLRVNSSVNSTVLCDVGTLTVVQMGHP